MATGQRSHAHMIELLGQFLLLRPMQNSKQTLIEGISLHMPMQKSKSEKFPPPHQDGALGHRLGSSRHMEPAFEHHDASFSTVFPYQIGQPLSTWSGPLVDPATIAHPKRKKQQSGGLNRLIKDKSSSRIR